MTLQERARQYVENEFRGIEEALEKSGIGRFLEYDEFVAAYQKAAAGDPSDLDVYFKLFEVHPSYSLDEDDVTYNSVRFHRAYSDYKDIHTAFTAGIFTQRAMDREKVEELLRKYAGVLYANKVAVNDIVKQFTEAL